MSFGRLRLRLGLPLRRRTKVAAWAWALPAAVPVVGLRSRAGLAPVVRLGLSFR